MSNSVKITLVMLGLFLVHSAPIQATTYLVPGDAPTIQAGIDLAGPGDVVQVACGEYYENGIEMKDGVTLRGESDTGACVTVHGEGGTAIWILSVTQCRIIGMNFKGCGTGALRLVYADPIIENCVFEGNSFSDGGAIHMLSSNPTITGCVFIGNTASHAGGAIAMGDCNPTITGCTFKNNTANYGGAIDIESDSAVVMQNCQLENNVAQYAGGGLFVWQNLGPSAFTGSGLVIMNNQAPQGADGYADVYCFLTIYESTLDPSFEDTFAGPGIIMIDSVVATEPRSWDSVKAFYR